MISLILGIIVVIALVYIARLVIDWLGLPHPIPTILYILIALAVLFWLLGALGVVADTPFHTLR